MQSLTLTVEIRGYTIDLEVYANLSSGGSSSWGSDEPPWFDVDITDIRNHRRNKSISTRLWDEIMKHYEDYLVEQFEYAYM
jgi:hypothetical protein